MASFEENIRRAYNRIQRTQMKITGTICELVDIQNLMGPFLYRYSKEIIPLHEDLLKKWRAIEDLKALKGIMDSRHRKEMLTPLTAITRENDLSVQEQYDRRWGGKEYAKLENFQQEIQRANDDIKSLYGQLVVNFHPMLSPNEKEAKRRRVTYLEATKAYLRRDKVTLKALLNTIPSIQLPAVVNEDAVKRIEKQANDLELLLKNLESQLFEIKYGDAAKLYVQAEFLKGKNINLLDQLIKQLKQEIMLADQKISSLSS